MDRYIRKLKEYVNILITFTFAGIIVKAGNLLGMWENSITSILVALVVYLLIEHFKDEKNWWIGRNNTSDK